MYLAINVYYWVTYVIKKSISFLIEYDLARTKDFLLQQKISLLESYAMLQFSE